MKSHSRNLTEVYVWEIPVRFFHWFNALCIVVLCITGYIIGDPPAIQHGTEAIHNYWFGYVRLTHLVTGMLFTLNIAFRVYWAFAGNHFAHWQNFIPLTRRQWISIFKTIKVDILLLTKHPVYDIGHNSLAATTYLGLFLLSVVQILTGFMMMFVTTNNVGEPATTWMLFGLNGFFVVRYIHHFLMWAFIIFACVHIYLVFYHDYIERNGIASSMIGGWKFINSQVVEDYLEIREKECKSDSKLERFLNDCEIGEQE